MNAGKVAVGLLGFACWACGADPRPPVLAAGDRLAAGEIDVPAFVRAASSSEPARNRDDYWKSVADRLAFLRTCQAIRGRTPRLCDAVRPVDAGDHRSCVELSAMYRMFASDCAVDDVRRSALAFGVGADAMEDLCRGRSCETLPPQAVLLCRGIAARSAAPCGGDAKCADHVRARTGPREVKSRYLRGLALASRGAFDCEGEFRTTLGPKLREFLADSAR